MQGLLHQVSNLLLYLTLWESAVEDLGLVYLWGTGIPSITVTSLVQHISHVPLCLMLLDSAQIVVFSLSDRLKVMLPF